MVDADPTRAAYNTVIATVLVRRFAVGVAVGAAKDTTVTALSPVPPLLT